MKENQSFLFGPLVLHFVSALISGWVHEPHHRVVVLVMLLAVWTLYCWWSERESYKLYLYFMLAMAAFGLLFWSNPLLPWWIFTAVITIGAAVLFVLLHVRAWKVMDI